MVGDIRYKFVAAHGTNGGELYELEMDPYERHNLWGDPDCREIKIAMQEQLIHRMAWTVDPLPEGQAPW